MWQIWSYNTAADCAGASDGSGQREAGQGSTCGMGAIACARHRMEGFGGA